MPLPPSVAGVRWRTGRPDDVDALTAIAAAADAVDAPGAVRTREDVAQLLAAVRPDRALVVGEREDAAVAFGIRFRPGGGPVRLLGAVEPGSRGRGVGRVLLASMMEGAAAAEPDAPLMTVRSGGAGGVVPLARRLGFVETRVFLTMRRDFAQPIEPVAVPDGLRLVPFGPELDEPLRIAKNEIFRDHWQGLADDPEEWRIRALGPRLLRDRSRVALDADDGVAGFVVVHRSEDHPRRAHIPLVGTAQAHRGRGVARALLADVLRRSAAAGLADAELDVDASSPTGAHRVYAAVGFSETWRATVWSRPL